MRDVLADRARGTTSATARTPTAAPPPTTTPTTCCCASIRCVNGEVQVTLDCEPRFDYGRLHGAWEYTGAGYHEARCTAEGTDVELRLTTDMNVGFEGPRATARTLMHEGDTLFVALSWSEHPAPTDLRGGLRPARLDRPPLAALARPRPVPRPPLAHRTCSAARSRSRGSPTRRPARWWRPPRPRCPRRPAASATGTTATPGSATPRSCSGASTRSASTGRRTTSSTSSPTSRRPRRSRSRSCTASAASPSCPRQTLDHLSGYEGARPVRIGNGAYNQDQHDVWGALLDSVYLHTKSRDHLPERIWPILEEAGGGRARELARARPRHLGGPRRAASTSPRRS